MAWTRPGPARGPPERESRQIRSSYWTSGRRGRRVSAAGEPLQCSQTVPTAEHLFGKQFTLAQLVSIVTMTNFAPGTEAQGKFISSLWSLMRLKERHLNIVGFQLPVLSQFLRPDLNCQESNSTLKLQDKAVDSSSVTTLKTGVWKRIMKMKIWANSSSLQLS